MKQTNAVVILDGFGFNEKTAGNAVKACGTPNISAYMAAYPWTKISASGRAVGLPEGQMGNSEVGHLNIGAGRVVYQDITMIDKSIEDGDFFENPAFLGAAENAKKHGGAVHLVGLLSDGGVHSMNTHLYALIELFKRQGVKNIRIHCITDGRDVPPDSAAGYLKALGAVIREKGAGRIATVVGRYYIMDRDNRWERVKKGYDAVFSGVGERSADPEATVRARYKNKEFDEFLLPIIDEGYTGVRENDSMVFFNFRSDRAREITRAAVYPDFAEFDRAGGYKKTFYVGMTQYDATFTDIRTAYPPKDIKNTLGQFLADSGFTQTRIAETEKYAHVTFFFNGGVEEPNKNEQRVLVPSPKVATYDLKPEMSAYEVTEKALAVIGETDVLILNFANCDMVGHTGVFEAAVQAVRTVDACVKRVADKVLSTGGTALLTADHGNAETMSFEDGSPCTSHTTNPVPFVVIGARYQNAALRPDGALCDIAPTLLAVMGVEKPTEMTGQSLIKR
ncbi:MAG: 2,3-bisphosphoglycerate-independent phosphoglycerate mutase [Clostridiales bacterium]|jgi:2,3-bisphosphoglycerate-independent phosphoglycerate mutase|nr:2,3-bisphosphoglycerate-independent phosphoglycerate mutase [Clostridiales bacterium]